MAAQPTSIPPITADGFAQRIGQTPMFPRGWASDGARQNGGVFYALSNALGTQLAFLITQLEYALNSQRIQTETSPELDLASVDFFGQGVLPRPQGMNDATYLALIKANLLQQAATRQAVSNAIQNLTGVKPRIVESWNPGDTGCMDTGLGFLDVDTLANPMEITSSLRFQGFIQTILPPQQGLGNGNPLLTFDDGAFMDENAYGDTAIGIANGVAALYAAINKVRPFGTIAWVKVVSAIA